jgi:hypothetical protein
MPGHSARVTDEAPTPIQRAPREEQILAILGPNIFKWAVESLPEGVRIDDVRYRDLVSVTEDDVFSHVAARCFDRRVVAEDAELDNRICILNSAHGWRVFFTERGHVSNESLFQTKEEAKRDVVRQLMHLARMILNHRYWHAHDLAFPCGDE